MMDAGNTHKPAVHALRIKKPLYLFAGQIDADDDQRRNKLGSPVTERHLDCLTGINANLSECVMSGGHADAVAVAMLQATKALAKMPVFKILLLNLQRASAHYRRGHKKLPS